MVAFDAVYRRCQGNYMYFSYKILHVIDIIDIIRCPKNVLRIWTCKIQNKVFLKNGLQMLS